jgi:isoquinoline 1-oxidoreductase beta subunit
MPSFNRRVFLKVLASGGAALALGIYFANDPALATAGAAPPSSMSKAQAMAAQAAQFAPNIYLRIDQAGSVTVTAFRSEMGQGVRTALAMIVAEELDADWATVQVEQAPADSAYGDQVTGGSRSVASYYTPLRKAGAAARQMLVRAAAAQWNVEPATCTTKAGWVIHPDGEQRLAYGALVASAAQVEPPKLSDVPLKEPKEFRLIGTRIGHWDAPAIVSGKALFGLDVKRPGMLYATVVRCPVFGGRASRFDASQTSAVKGVRQVMEIKSGIAVVADSTWAALQGRAALRVTWDEGRNNQLSSASIHGVMAKLAPKLGEADENTLEALYEIPFEAHADMEPMNCVADVRADRCELWAPTQDPQQAKSVARSITGLPADAVQVHVPLLGGGFGRRLQTDYVAEAVELSKAAGAPVQVVWTREDDIQHDFYHPANLLYVSAKLDKPPKYLAPRASPGGALIPTGAWRSVENFPEAFARESFLDEYALAVGKDPYQLRRELNTGRAKAVIELAAEQAGWGDPLPTGWGRGMAYHATFGVTHVAQVVELSVEENGTIRVHRVVCAVDCGTAINPDAVEAQMEGGIVFGLTAALKAQITLAKGRVEQSNFDDYPLLRLDEMPRIEVYLVPSSEPPSGIGEMGVPPTAPAVANAVFAATGQRIRHLPILPQDLRNG